MGPKVATATSRPPAPKADLATAAALVVAAALPSLLTWLYLRNDGPDLFSKAVYGLGKVIQCALPLAFALLWERRLPRPTWPTTNDLALGLGFGLAVAAGVLALYFGWLRGSPYLAHTAAAVLAVLRKFGLDSLPGYLALTAGIVFANTLFEEYYYRWFLFGRLRAFVAEPAAILLSALAFMAHHVLLLTVYFPGQFWTAAAPLALGVAAGGALWAWLYARTGSLYAPWLSHALIDLAVLGIGWDLSRRG